MEWVSVAVTAGGPGQPDTVELHQCVTPLQGRTVWLKSSTPPHNWPRNSWRGFCVSVCMCFHPTLPILTLQPSSITAKFNGVQTFIHKTIEFCHAHGMALGKHMKCVELMMRLLLLSGYVSSMLGRKRFLPSVHSHNHADRTHSERQAVNFIVQGSAADLCKCSMVEVMELLSNECPRAR